MWYNASDGDILKVFLANPLEEIGMITKYMKGIKYGQ